VPSVGIFVVGKGAAMRVFDICFSHKYTKKRDFFQLQGV